MDRKNKKYDKMNKKKKQLKIFSLLDVIAIVYFATSGPDLLLMCTEHIHFPSLHSCVRCERWRSLFILYFSRSSFT